MTYSCPGCTSKTVNGIVAQNSRATIVNVKLHCTPTAVVQVWKPQSSKFSITAMKGSIIIKCCSIREVVRVGIYDIQGRQVQSLTVPPDLKNITIAWNANRAGSRCYVARVESSEGSFQKLFVLSN